MLPVVGYDLFGKHYMRCSPTALSIVQYRRKPVRRGFAKAYVARDHCIEHHFGKMPLELFIYLVGQAQARVIHGQQEAFNLKLRIKA